MLGSFWLLPSALAAAAYQEQINLCAREVDRPSFAAHVTLVVQAHALSTAALSRIVNEFLPLRLHAGEFVESDVYFRSLIRRMRLSPQLADLRRALHAAARPGPVAHLYAAEEYDPHISLLYGPAAPLQKNAMLARAAAALTDGEPEFDAIAFVETSAEVGNWSFIQHCNIE